MNSNFSARFGLLFYSDTSKAEQGLSAIAKGVEGIQSTMMALDGAASRVFQGVTSIMKAMGSELLGTASKLETTQAKFRFAFRQFDQTPAEIDKRWAAVELAGLRTVQSTNDIADAMAMLQSITRADVFSDATQDALKKASPTLTNFGELFGDMAAIAEFGTRSAQKGLSALLSGEWGRAGKNLDQIQGKMQDYKDAMKGVNTNAEKMVKIMPLLVRDFGGSSERMGKTFGFLVAQFDDVHDKLLGTFGKPMMDALKGPLREILDYFVGEPDGLLLPQNINRLDAIKGVFVEVGKALADVATWTWRAAKGIGEFLMSHPGLIKFAGTMLTVVGASSGIVAALMSIRLIAAAVGFAFSGWLGPIAAVVAGLVALVGYMASTEEGMKNLQDMWAGFTEGMLKNKQEIMQALYPLMTRFEGYFKNINGLANDAGTKWRGAGLSIADALTGAIKVFASILDHAFAMGEWLVKHKDLMVDIFTAWAGYKAVTMVSGGISAIKGMAGGASVLGDPGGPTTRVFVVNMGQGGMGGAPGAPGMPTVATVQAAATWMIPVAIGAAGVAMTLSALGNITAPLNQNIKQITDETKAQFDTKRYGQINEIVAAFQASRTGDSSEILGSMGKPLVAAIERDPVLQDVVRAIRSGTYNIHDMDTGAANALGAAVKDTTSPSLSGIRDAFNINIYVDGQKSIEKKIEVDKARIGSEEVGK